MIKGQVGLVPTDGGPKSGVVAWASGSKWCHMIVAVSETHCVSAEPRGVRIRPHADYPEICWSHFPMRPSQRRRSAQYALRRIGTPYAWADYIAAGIALVTRTRTPEWLRAYVADTDRLICSQLADLSLQAAGIHVFFDERPAGAVIPSSFARVFIARGWTDEP